jgi:hypothetical protein
MAVLMAVLTGVLMAVLMAVLTAALMAVLTAAPKNEEAKFELYRQ